METPILDFVQQYAADKKTRFHMPGHKGKRVLGCEAWDITEVQGADALYEAEGIIARSEEHATRLFGSGRTLYSTEGSSQCIRAMLYLALTNRQPDTPPVIVAARNVHKSFVYAAALLDARVEWLWPKEQDSICGCLISEEQLEWVLKGLSVPPAAVYVTSPDYLGGITDISALAKVCHRYHTLLLVDNAHGAYLRFLKPSLHPLDLGADLCCDSAHKTLPVLTGGAYLHIGKRALELLSADAKFAMALFGSTSPSYLILSSLDRCNRTLSEDYPSRLADTVEAMERLKQDLLGANWQVELSDPLKLTLRAPEGSSGIQLAQQLRSGGIECEYADEDFLVLMLTPENTLEELEDFRKILGENPRPQARRRSLPRACGEQVISMKRAMSAPHELIPAEEALGRICGAPTVACPPAIPIAVWGERIDEAAVTLFRSYGVKHVDVLKEV